ncbi:MAG: hypothetical protein IPP51_16645 [Bacteroidetes bacterium]|nr:hypothetical protein [Bacteroidota bacterium]
MKTFRPLLSWIMLLSIISLFSCGKEEYLKSEAGIKKQLSGSWNLVPIPRTSPDQLWTFSDETFSRLQGSTSYDGTYSVNTTMFKAEIKVENMPIVSGERNYNGTWQIVRVDSDFLILVNDGDGTTGITELEFTKKQ